jgi:hypothetical protein
MIYRAQGVRGRVRDITVRGRVRDITVRGRVRDITVRGRVRDITVSATGSMGGKGHDMLHNR